MASEASDYWPTEGWQTSPPAEQGLDGDVLAHIHEFGLDTDPPANGYVVVRNGYLVYEEYFRGFTDRSFHCVYSVTKSVVSALIGIALRDGLLPSVDQTVADFFPEIELDDDRKRRITIKHLLTMTSGFSEALLGRPYLEQLPVAEAQLAADDLLGIVWRRALLHDPGTHFLYDDVVVQLLSMVLTRITGVTAAEYAYRELFDPIGIWSDERMRYLWRTEPFGRHTFFRWGFWPENGLLWKLDKHGNSLAAAGVHLTLREMAKLGWLYANGGKWDDKQIIPKDYVAESIRPQCSGTFVGSDQPVSHYGYLWWIRDDHGRFDLSTPSTFMALGFGGQAIWVAPNTNLVVALATSPRAPAPAAIGRIVVPALRQAPVSALQAAAATDRTA